MRDEIKVVNDQIGCPTYTFELADTMIGLAQNGSRGIYHFSNQPACSWYDFACEIVATAGLSCKVNPCKTEDFPRPAQRPAYSVLDISKTVDALKHPVGLWKDSLRDYISKRN
jgi:dTDP-4-dehydrorhamnose reductase